MPPPASWGGRARIKGYTKLQRMAMLTFSLIGLQPVSLALLTPCANADGVRQIHLGGGNDLYPSLLRPAVGPFHSWHLCRLRAASLETGFGEESDFARVDRSSAVRVDCAAGCGGLVGFFAAEVG